MRRLATPPALAAVALCAATALLAGCPPKAMAPVPATVALVVTPSEAADPYAYRGVEALVAADAAAASASAKTRASSAPVVAIRHAVLPEAPTAKARAAALSALLLESAKDPLVRAALVVPAVDGTADAFRALRAQRRDIVRIAANPTEDRLSIESAVDLVVELDRLYRPYLAAASAKKAGARALVEASAKGPFSPARERESAVLRAACAELGLTYVLALADPGDRGRSLVGELGADRAVYCADAALADAVVGAALATGAFVVDGGPGSLDACYRALAPSLPEDVWSIDADKRFKLLEKVAVAAAGRGRLSVWTRDYAAQSVEGLAEFARRVAAGSARVDDLKDIVAALKSRTAGSAWIAAYDADPGTGVKAANHVLIRQDPYAFGRGYEQSALRMVPPKFLAIGPASR